MMTTKDDDKSDEQKAQVNQRTSQENQEQVKSSRIKKNSRLKKKVYNQESRFKTQDLKNQDQDSRIKKGLNQDKY